MMVTWSLLPYVSTCTNFMIMKSWIRSSTRCHRFNQFEGTGEGRPVVTAIVLRSGYHGFKTSLYNNPSYSRIFIGSCL